MGFFLSKSMDANLKRQQEFMLHNSRLQVSDPKCSFSINAGVILIFWDTFSKSSFRTQSNLLPNAILIFQKMHVNFNISSIPPKERISLSKFSSSWSPPFCCCCIKFCLCFFQMSQAGRRCLVLFCVVVHLRWKERRDHHTCVEY